MKHSIQFLFDYKKIIIVIPLLFILNYIATAQNSSYSANTLGIGGFYNVALGIQSQSSNNTFAFYNTSVGYQSLYANTSGGYNTAHGYWSLYANTTGAQNTGIGHRALYANTTGNANTALGSSALTNNINGSSNSAFGVSSLFSNTTGYGNLAIGESSLNANTTGYWNVGIGNSSLYGNISGYLNTGIGLGSNVGSGNLTNATAIGSYAVVNNSNSIQLGNSSVTSIYSGVGTNTTLITGGLKVTGGTPGIGKVLTSDASGGATWQTPSGGNWSLTGNAGTVDNTNFIGTTDNVPFNIRVNNQKAGRIDQFNANTFFGIAAGRDNTIGFFNTAYGFNALAANTSGAYNTAIGRDALRSNIDGTENMALGEQALGSNTSGGLNIAMGRSALGDNTDGYMNVAVGGGALLHNTTGFGNTAIGVGSNSVYQNTGNLNTSIGFFAFTNNDNGNNNTALGTYADFVSPSAFDNSTAIGSGALVNLSNKIRLGDAIVTEVEGPIYNTVSDGRFKKNISETDVKGLEFINRLRPVVYNFDTKKFQEFLTQNMPDSTRRKYFDNKDFTRSSALRQSGFIAQEVESTAKEVGYDFNGVHIPESKDDNYSLAYGQFVVPLVKAVQELSAQNEMLKKEMEELKALVRGNSQINANGSINIILSNEGSKLFQNAPNPFNQSTTIRYSIPPTAKKAIITIATSGGSKLKTFDLKSNGRDNIEISGGQLSAGTYIYSLIVDDILIDSKWMVLTH